MRMRMRTFIIASLRRRQTCKINRSINSSNDDVQRSKAYGELQILAKLSTAITSRAGDLPAVDGCPNR